MEVSRSREAAWHQSVCPALPTLEMLFCCFLDGDSIGHYHVAGAESGSTSSLQPGEWSSLLFCGLHYLPVGQPAPLHFTHSFLQDFLFWLLLSSYLIPSTSLSLPHSLTVTLVFSFFTLFTFYPFSLIFLHMWWTYAAWNPTSERF